MSLEQSIDGLTAAIIAATSPAAESTSPAVIFHIHQITEQTQPIILTPHAQRAPIGAVSAMLDLTDSQMVTLSVAFKDKKGNPAPTDGVPSWGVDNSDVLAIAPSADGLSCVVSAVGPLGTGLVSVQADADLGAGVTPIAGTMQVTVKAAAASVVAIAAGDVSEQPEVAATPADVAPVAA